MNDSPTPVPFGKRVRPLRVSGIPKQPRKLPHRHVEVRRSFGVLDSRRPSVSNAVLRSLGDPRRRIEKIVASGIPVQPEATRPGFVRDGPTPSGSTRGVRSGSTGSAGAGPVGSFFGIAVRMIVRRLSAVNFGIGGDCPAAPTNIYQAPLGRQSPRRRTSDVDKINPSAVDVGPIRDRTTQPIDARHGRCSRVVWDRRFPSANRPSSIRRANRDKFGSFVRPALRSEMFSKESRNVWATIPPPAEAANAAETQLRALFRRLGAVVFSLSLAEFETLSWVA